MTWPTFWDRVQDDQEEFIGWLKTYVSTWTENTIQNWNKPTVEDFLYEYPEYNHDALLPTIEKEMNRIESLCRHSKELVTPEKRVSDLSTDGSQSA